MSFVHLKILYTLTPLYSKFCGHSAVTNTLSNESALYPKLYALPYLARGTSNIAPRFPEVTMAV